MCLGLIIRNWGPTITDILKSRGLTFKWHKFKYLSLRCLNSNKLKNVIIIALVWWNLCFILLKKRKL